MSKQLKPALSWQVKVDAEDGLQRRQPNDRLQNCYAAGYMHKTHTQPGRMCLLCFETWTGTPLHRCHPGGHQCGAYTARQVHSLHCRHAAGFVCALSGSPPICRGCLPAPHLAPPDVCYRAPGDCDPSSAAAACGECEPCLVPVPFSSSTHARCHTIRPRGLRYTSKHLRWQRLQPVRQQRLEWSSHQCSGRANRVLWSLPHHLVLVPFLIFPPFDCCQVLRSALVSAALQDIVSPLLSQLVLFGFLGLECMPVCSANPLRIALLCRGPSTRHAEGKVKASQRHIAQLCVTFLCLLVRLRARNSVRRQTRS